MHVLHLNRVDEMHPRRIAQHCVRRLPNPRIGMHRIHHMHLRVILHQAEHGAADAFQGRPQVLPAMGSHQNPSALIQRQVGQGGVVEAIAVVHHQAQRVYHRVAHHMHIFRNAFPQQVFPAALGGGKMQRGQPARQHSVHFLRKGGIPIVGAQPGLHMTHCHLPVKGRQRRGGGGGGIAMHQHQIRPAVL